MGSGSGEEVTSCGLILDPNPHRVFAHLMGWVIVTSRSHGHGDIIVTYIRKAKIPSHTYVMSRSHGYGDVTAT